MVLIHGGLAEDMDAARFWIEPGVVGALVRAGFEVAAPDRDTCPASWAAAADAVAEQMTEPATVVAGSNGVSVAVRLALQHRELALRLALLWPASAGDASVDARVPAAADHLLTGETLRGVADAELAGLGVPVAVMASEPENPIHRHRTVERLVELVPDATQIRPRFPEAPRPEFRPQLDAFVAAVVPHL